MLCKLYIVQANFRYQHYSFKIINLICDVMKNDMIAMYDMLVLPSEGGNTKAIQIGKS